MVTTVTFPPPYYLSLFLTQSLPLYIALLVWNPSSSSITSWVVGLRAWPTLLAPFEIGRNSEERSRVSHTRELSVVCECPVMAPSHCWFFVEMSGSGLLQVWDPHIGDSLNLVFNVQCTLPMDICRVCKSFYSCSVSTFSYIYSVFYCSRGCSWNGDHSAHPHKC